MPFEKGQQVIIKNPGELVATVIGPRPGDKDSPDDGKKLYKVRVEERFYRAEDLEPLPPPSNKLERYSAEWVLEFTKMADALQRWNANNNDRAAWDQFVESGEKVGLIVPEKKQEPEPSVYEKRGIVFI